MSKIEFDVVFYDVTANKPYDALSLDTEPLGGTEATVIRIAQGLGAIGYRVAVVQHSLLSETNYGNVFYLPASYLDKLKPAVFVMLRGITGNHLYPKARKYAWLHDLPNDKLMHWYDKIIENDITIIAVSKWHKLDIKRLVCNAELAVNPKVIHIYNPVDDALYGHNPNKYDKNKFVWMSSPHKGLDKGLELFKRAQEILGDKLRFHVYNPGYLTNTLSATKGVVAHGPVPPAQMWGEIANAMCLFYPCGFEETFGLVVAEVNAMQIPTITYSLGALPEIVSSHEQLVNNKDEVALLKRVESWYAGYRPNVVGKDEFKLSRIIRQWDYLLRGKSISTE